MAAALSITVRTTFDPARYLTGSEEVVVADTGSAGSAASVAVSNSFVTAPAVIGSRPILTKRATSSAAATSVVAALVRAASLDSEIGPGPNSVMVAHSAAVLTSVATIDSSVQRIAA